MTTKTEIFQDPVKNLFYLATHSRFIPEELAGGIRSLKALLEDLGKDIKGDIKSKWEDRLLETTSDCERNAYGIPPELQPVCECSLRVLEAVFYQVVEENHEKAAKLYEQAARVITGETISIVAKLHELGLLFSQDLADYYCFRAFFTRVIQATLWDQAGDAYCRVGNKQMDGRQCYEKGVAILKEIAVKFDLQWQRTLCHLLLSLAEMRLAEADGWDEAEHLIRESADIAFFNREKRDNAQYQDLCFVLFGRSNLIERTGDSDLLPHIDTPVNENHKEKLDRLKAELGEKALIILGQEFNKSEESFPVPETYYLVAVLSQLYLELKEYDKCANLSLMDTPFAIRLLGGHL